MNEIDIFLTSTWKKYVYSIDKILFSVAHLSITMILEGEGARTRGGGLETH